METKSRRWFAECCVLGWMRSGRCWGNRTRVGGGGESSDPWETARPACWGSCRTPSLSSEIETLLPSGCKEGASRMTVSRRVSGGRGEAGRSQSDLPALAIFSSSFSLSESVGHGDIFWSSLSAPSFSRRKLSQEGSRPEQIVTCPLNQGPGYLNETNKNKG